MRKALERYRSQILVFLAVLGPGFITAMVDNDAGGIYTYSAAGAKSCASTLLMVKARLAAIKQMTEIFMVFITFSNSSSFGKAQRAANA